MCQHSWYDPNRRHYGPKPNTRRARGLRNRNYGIKTGPRPNKRIESLQPVEVDKNVKPMPIPNSMKVMKRYVRIYNWYVQHYDKWPDKELCMTETAKRFDLTLLTIRKAIDTCKYILATQDQK
jgi:hypothetical protein